MLVEVAMAKQPTVRVSTYLMPEQYEALRREAFERRGKITALVRQAVDLWLEAQRKERR
ncbi:MAG: hypothetical protein KJ624_02110 [Chloroflexi bacterium]|nr:hypothetical protein [Chloroflexota bacterium]